MSGFKTFLKTVNKEKDSQLTWKEKYEALEKDIESLDFNLRQRITEKDQEIKIMKKQLDSLAGWAEERIELMREIERLKNLRPIIEKAHLDNEELAEEIERLKGEALKEFDRGWQLAHEPAKCGHARANYKDPNYPNSEGNEECEFCQEIKRLKGELCWEHPLYHHQRIIHYWQKDQCPRCNPEPEDNDE